MGKTLTTIGLLLGALGAAPFLPAAGGAPAAPPSNTSRPTIAGTPAKGETLTASAGSWSGSTPMTFAYQWRRCDSAAGANCVDIAGADGPTYTVASGDVGRRIRVRVTATNADGASSRGSAATRVVTRGEAPRNTSPPVVDGDFREGGTLFAATGDWTGTRPISFAFQWQRCNADGGNCGSISGATTGSYVLTSADAGRRLRAAVTASNSAGSRTATSTATPVIAARGAAPRNTATPRVSGTPIQGQTLTLDLGAWTGDQPITFSFGWQRCDSRGAGCAAIAGAGTPAYTVTAADVGHTTRGVVTATNRFGTTSAVSAPTGVVQSGAAPANVDPPRIVGAPQEGQTLAISPGTWSGSRPINFAYDWQRCDGAGVNCVPLGVRSQTYTVAAADVERTLRAVVTATNPAGARSAVSSPTPVIAPAVARQAAAVPVSTVSLPNRLVIAGVSFTPRVLRSRAPFLLRVVVRDTRGRPVIGALVLAVGVPFGRVSSAPEAVTGADGVAAITLVPTRRLRLVRGGFLIVFLRARKPGEPVLAGVSTRRLVSVRTAPPAN